ncbi:MAG TPA: sugar transferase [Asticcacaulis sp.]|nr:sugar transferase [Asticcacaulis sp.]
MKYEMTNSASVPLAPYRASKRSSAPPAKDHFVRAFDLICSLLAVAFLFPAFLAIAIAIKLQDGGPVLFKHTRIGLNGREFKCLKFRSMHVKSQEILDHLLATDAEARAEWEADHKLRNDPRITPIGKFLRKTSLDEFPQLINVIMGQMSLVGPRPIIRAEISKYSRSFRHYTSVMPGITGLWQVMGRNDVTYRRRVALDRLFVRRKSFRLYVAILFLTFPAVLNQSGSY